jgi:hypothetical protein
MSGRHDKAGKNQPKLTVPLNELTIATDFGP